jgi:hypothetical protein
MPSLISAWHASTASSRERNFAAGRAIARINVPVPKPRLDLLHVVELFDVAFGAALIPRREYITDSLAPIEKCGWLISAGARGSLLVVA